LCKVLVLRGLGSRLRGKDKRGKRERQEGRAGKTRGGSGKDKQVKYEIKNGKAGKA
jgi:hypothetical protein